MIIIRYKRGFDPCDMSMIITRSKHEFDPDDMSMIIIRSIRHYNVSLYDPKQESHHCYIAY